MGEIAEMLLDGTMCEGCGEFLDGEAPGFPRYCPACGGDDDYSRHDTDRPRGRRSERDTPCPDCGKMCRGEVGLAGHQHSKHFPQHAARFCAGYSTEALEGVTLAEVVEKVRKIAELRYVEDANEPFDDALDLADEILSRLTKEGGKP